MGMVLSIDGKLTSVTRKHPGKGYERVALGKPMSVELKVFFPGTRIKEWGNKAEILITSQVRLGRPSDPAPQVINLLLRDYAFKQPEPVGASYGGDLFGEPMLYYTKAYTGATLRFTLKGVEVDKISPGLWKGVNGALKSLSGLALFSPAAPYLAAAGLASNVAKTLSTAFLRNDRLDIKRGDLYFGKTNDNILQSGRYVFWNEKKGTGYKAIKSGYRLTGAGDDVPNLLVTRGADPKPYTQSPYFVVEIDGRARPDYDDFELKTESGKLLEQLADKDLATSILAAASELGGQINDAKQLSQIRGQVRALKNAGTEAEKATIREKIKAHTRLFSEDNTDLLKDLLGKYAE